MRAAATQKRRGNFFMRFSMQRRCAVPVLLTDENTRTMGTWVSMHGSSAAFSFHAAGAFKEAGPFPAPPCEQKLRSERHGVAL